MLSEHASIFLHPSDRKICYFSVVPKRGALEELSLYYSGLKLHKDLAGGCFFNRGNKTNPKQVIGGGREIKKNARIIFRFVDKYSLLNCCK